MSSTELAVASRDVTFSASVAGGEAPYTIDWDLNGDAFADAAGATVTSRFTQSGNHTISATVTDATECTTTAEIQQAVAASRIIADTVGDPSEICGDGDQVIEPGERFAIPVTFSNVGDASGTDLHALLAHPSPSSTKLTLGPDRYGYELADQDEATCRLDFLDISQTANALDVDLDDDGAVVDLAGDGVSLYGELFQQLLISDNGYLSTDLGDDGSDFFVTCPLPSRPRFATPATRVYAFWDDLALFSGAGPTGRLYYQYFDQCPRAADRGTTSGCHVFQWNDASYGSGGPRNLTNRDGAVLDVQAIFYEGSDHIVLQKRGVDPVNGRDSVMGIVNATGDDGLGYRCEVPKGPENAVCLFAPASETPSPVASTGVRLETPALALGNLDVGESTTVNVRFKLEESFTCGERVGFDYVGSVGEENYSPGDRPLLIDVVTGDDEGTCGRAASCPIELDHDIAPENGLLYNPLRPGNGADVQYVGSNVAFLWYTATAQHLPIWYFNADRYEDNRASAELKRFTFGGSFVPGHPSGEVVGRSMMTWLEADRMIWWWNLAGQQSAEIMTILRTSSEPTDDAITAQWFNPDESGWGLAFNRQGDVEVQTAYLYDDAGAPVWLLSGATEAGMSELKSFRWVHCPGCPWTSAQPMIAGTLERTFDEGSGIVSVDISLPAPLSGTWQRIDLPIQKID